MTVNDSGAPIARQNPMHVKHSICRGQMAPNVPRERYVSLYLTVSSKSLSRSLCLRLCLLSLSFPKNPHPISLYLYNSPPPPTPIPICSCWQIEQKWRDPPQIHEQYFFPSGLVFDLEIILLLIFFSNLWHILSLIYRIKGKFKKNIYALLII